MIPRKTNTDFSQNSNNNNPSGYFILSLFWRSNAISLVKVNVKILELFFVKTSGEHFINVKKVYHIQFYEWDFAVTD